MTRDDSVSAVSMQPGNPRCPRCGHPLRMVLVHGHGQCGTCGMNIQPCCDGDSCTAGQPTPERPNG
ncbi:MAG: hypothetical protein EBU31_11705 [Proteobacteria bacterium]|jgi:transposase-like protein|nr:hypothetical protein [Pseudomonadota bacterium]